LIEYPLIVFAESTSIFPVNVTVTDGDQINKVSFADHSNSSTDGNWIKLSGGTSVELPELTARYSGATSKTYTKNGRTINIVSEFGEKAVKYPFSSHPVYYEGDAVSATFYGSSQLAGDTVDFYLIKGVYAGVVNAVNEALDGNGEPLRNLARDNVVWSATDVTLDSNGDYSVSFSAPEPGDYGLVVVRITTGSNSYAVKAYSATAVEVLDYQVSLTASSSVLSGSFLDVDVSLVDASESSTSGYRYGAALIHRDAYSGVGTLLSDGTVAGTNVTVNGVFVNGSSSPLSFNIGGTEVAKVGDVTVDFLVGRLSELVDSDKLSLGYSDKKAGTSASLSLSTDGLKVGDYILFVGVYEHGTGKRAVAFTSKNVTVAVYTFSISPDVSSKTISVGESAVHTFNITNQGNVQDTFNLTRTGTGVLSASNVTLDAGAWTTFTLTYSTPARGFYTDTVTAISQGNASATYTVTALTKVERIPEEPEEPEIPLDPGDLEEEDPEDAADDLEQADPDDAADVVEDLETDTAADIFEEMDEEAAAEILELVETEVAADIIEEMNVTDAAEIIDEMVAEVAAEIFEEIAADEAAEVLVEVEVEAAAEIIGEMNTTAAADIVEEFEAEAAAEIFDVMDVSDAAVVIEEVEVESAADIFEEMNVTVAADVIEEVVVETAADIVIEMEGESAAEILADTNVTAAVAIVEVVVEVSEEEAGDLLDAVVETNNTEAFAVILNEMDENATAGALLASEPESGGAIVEEMAKQDLGSAAERVEAAVKLRTRELDPEQQAAVLQMAADMLEEVTVDSLVDLFVAIANLPATPSTVAEVLAVMDLVKVLEVVDAMMDAGYLEELGSIFGYLPAEPLANIWNGMTVEGRSSIFTYLSDETISELPIVVSRYPLVVVHLKGALGTDIQFDAAMGDMDYVEWHIVYNGLTAGDLDEASMLIMIQADSSLDYTEEELAAVKAWYERGGKAIWVASDSDYGTDSLRQGTANSVLEYLGSKLRIESASTEDPVSNGFAPYRVLAVSDYVDPEYGFLVSGVDRGLFHGPGIVVGYSGGQYYKLEEMDLDNVHVIMTTSVNGVVVDNSEPSPEAHEAGDEGTFPVMVLEVDYENTGVIIATGDAPFGQYAGLYRPELKRADRYGLDVNPQQGGRLFQNVIDYVTQYSGLLVGSVNTMEAREDTITSLGNQVTSLQGENSDLEDDISALETEVADLESQVSGLEDDVTSLGAEITSLEGQITSLEADIETKRSAFGSWQIYTVLLLVIGLVAGYFIEPYIKKP